MTVTNLLNTKFRKATARRKREEKAARVEAARASPISLFDDDELNYCLFEWIRRTMSAWSLPQQAEVFDRLVNRDRFEDRHDIRDSLAELFEDAAKSKVHLADNLNTRRSHFLRAKNSAFDVLSNWGLADRLYGEHPRGDELRCAFEVLFGGKTT